MTDLNQSNTLKNNSAEVEYKTNSDHLHSFEVLYNDVTAKTTVLKDAGGGNSYFKTEDVVSVSPKNDIHPSFMYDDKSFSDFPTTSANALRKVSADKSITTSDDYSKTFDELDRTFCINKGKSSKTSVLSDASVKYNIDKQSFSLISKNKSSSNFSIFGQLLNKKQNSSLSPKSPGNSNSYSCSSDSKQSQTSQLPRNQVSEPSDGVQRTQVKTKLRSMWNNVKYGWRIKREVNLKTDSAIWLLGQCYHNKLNNDVDLSQDVAEQLRLDLLSKVWLTYRINFPPIPGTNIVTDSGWGCMLRCGQMMMAQAFVCHFLQRGWRLSSHQTAAENQLYKTILRWFGDSLSDKSPFSLHNLVSLGQNYGRKAGDWYGPTHAAHVLRDALCATKQHTPLLQDLCMYVASDGIVFKDDVMELCMRSVQEEKTNSNTSLNSDFATVCFPETQGNLCVEMLKDSASADFVIMNEDMSEEPKSFEATCPSYSEFGPPSYSTLKPKWKSLILFVSVRLGNDKINPFYIPCLKSLLAYEHCIGIIGGRPKHALYFIGWQDDRIIHMDPHSCQPAVDVEKEDFSEKSFHSSSVRMMSFSEMDPSCSIGFYFKEHADFQFFVEKFSEITAPLKRNLEYPVFALADGKRIEVEDEAYHPDKNSSYPHLNEHYVDDGDDDNDYILL